MTKRIKRCSLPLLTGFAWGIAEATFFFVAPDVLLCYWAMRSGRAAIAATFAVVAGALLAACGLYASANYLGVESTAASLFRIWSASPDFRPAMAEIARGQLQQYGMLGLLAGPGSAIPYRVYVVEAFRLHLPLESFLAWTPIARLERILFAPIAVLAARLLFEEVLPRFWRKISVARARRFLFLMLVIYWIAFYSWYWGKLVPGRFG